MRNAKELRDDCAAVIADLRVGKINSREASSIANLAGKMISSTIAQLKHSYQREEIPEIDFLKEPGKTPKKVASKLPPLKLPAVKKQAVIKRKGVTKKKR